jgi:primase-polymerase (primpol)-like protein
MSFKFPKALELFYNDECWVGWKREARPDGTFTKPPYQPANPNLKAKPNDPSTWGSIAQTLVNVERKLLDGPGICALGANLFVRVDVDRCIDADGNIEPRRGRSRFSRSVESGFPDVRFR